MLKRVAREWNSLAQIIKTRRDFLILAREFIPARSRFLTLAGGFIVVRLGVLKRIAREWNSRAI